jgi:hypothetical protein
MLAGRGQAWVGEASLYSSLDQLSSRLRFQGQTVPAASSYPQLEHINCPGHGLPKHGLASYVRATRSTLFEFCLPTKAT